MCIKGKKIRDYRSELLRFIVTIGYVLSGYILKILNLILEKMCNREGSYNWARGVD